jgi:hypothetical protein
VRAAGLAVAVVGLLAAEAIRAHGGLGRRRTELQRVLQSVNTSVGQAAASLQPIGAQLSNNRTLWAVVTEGDPAMAGSTIRDLDRDDLHLPPQGREIIELGRTEPEGKPYRLRAIPRSEPGIAPLGEAGIHWSTRADRLFVSLTLAIPPRSPNVAGGVLGLSREVDLSAPVSVVDNLRWGARLRWDGGAITLGSIPFDSKGRAPVALDVPAMAGRGARLELQTDGPPDAVFDPIAQALAVGLCALGAGAFLFRIPRAPPSGPPLGGAHRYRTIRRIASGGMGEVWEAWALGANGFQRKVALKRIFPARHGDARLLRMFIDEAKIVSNLHHANIVSVLDFGASDGVPFQVLELVEGMDVLHLARLGDRCGSPISVELVLYICSQVAHALHYAHEARNAAGEPLHIVHRDVSPDNILVSWEGDVKLSDFGIALADGRMERTRRGVVKGKSRYMAPEQATGGTVDVRTDVFALGCVMCLLLAGDSPLGDDTQMTRFLAGEELWLPLSLPDIVHPIVARALRRSRLERYSSASAMAEAMSALLRTRLSRDPRLVLKEWLAPLRQDMAKTLPPLEAANAGDRPIFETLPTAADGSDRR